MALTRVQTTDLTGTLANTISESAAAATAAIEALPPKIANVQIANSSWSVLDDTAIDLAGGYVIINGSNYDSGCIVTINGTAATTVTRMSDTVLRAQVPAKAANSYTVYVVNPDGGTAIKLNGLTYSQFPAWSTGTTLTNQTKDAAFSINLSATSDSSVTYSLAAGSSLPAGTTLASNGLFSGTVTSISSDTTYSFSVQATDAENQNQSRTFSVTVTVPAAFVSLMSGGYNEYDRGSFYAYSTVKVSSGYVTVGRAHVACTYAGIQNKGTIVAGISATGNVSWSHNYGSSRGAGGGVPSWSGDLGVAQNSTNYESDVQTLYTTIVPFGTPKALVTDGTDAYSLVVGYTNPTESYVVKHYANGTCAWQTRLKDSQGFESRFWNLAINPSGNTLYALGSLSYTANVDNMTRQVIFEIDAANGSAKSATVSQTNWRFEMSQPAVIKIAPDGNIVVGGRHYGDFAVGKANSTIFDGTRQALWGYRSYSDTTAYVQDIAIDSNNDVYVLGARLNGEAPRTYFLKANGTSGSMIWQFAMANTGPARLFYGGGATVDTAGNGAVFFVTNQRSSNNELHDSYLFCMNQSNGQIYYQKRIVGLQYHQVTGVTIDGDYMIFQTDRIQNYTPADVDTYASAVVKLPKNGSVSNTDLMVTAVGHSAYLGGTISVTNSSITLSNPDISWSACSGMGYLMGGYSNAVIEVLQGANTLNDETYVNRLAVGNLKVSNAAITNNQYNEVIQVAV